MWTKQKHTNINIIFWDSEAPQNLYFTKNMKLFFTKCFYDRNHKICHKATLLLFSSNILINCLLISTYLIYFNIYLMKHFLWRFQQQNQLIKGCESFDNLGNEIKTFVKLFYWIFGRDNCFMMKLMKEKQKKFLLFRKWDLFWAAVSQRIISVWEIWFII